MAKDTKTKTIKETTIIDRIFKNIETLSTEAKSRVLNYVQGSVYEELRNAEAARFSSSLAKTNGHLTALPEAPRS